MISTAGWRGRIIAGAAILGSAIYLTIVVLHFLRDRDIAPMSDMMLVEAYLDRFNGPPDLLSAFAFIDNEHRPAFPLYAFALDHFYLGSRGLLPVLLSLASIAGVCGICLWRLVPEIDRPASRLAYALLFIDIMFWPAQFENFVFTKQFHACLSLLCLSAAFSLVVGLNCRIGGTSKIDERLRLGLLLSLIFVGTFSFGWGLVAAVTIGAYVLWRHWPLGLAGPVLLAVAATFCIYFLVWSPHHHQPALMDPWALIGAAGEYLCIFIGSPFLSIMDSPFGGGRLLTIGVASIGAAGIAAALWMLFCRRGLRARREHAVSAADEFVDLLLAFAMAAAVVTMWSRLAIGATQGSAPRYLFVPSLFWLGLLYRFAAWQGMPAPLRSLRPAAMLAVGIAVVSTTPVFFNIMAVRAFGDRLGAVAAVMGEDGVAAPPRLHPDPALIRAVFANYAAHSASVYGDPWPRWLGKPASDVFPANAPECQGYVDHTEPVPGSGDQQIDGWIWMPGGSDTRGWIGIVDRNGQIVGLGTTGFNRPDVAKFLKTGAARLAGFSGYVHARRDDVVAVYGLFGDNAWCRLSIAG